MRLQNAYKQCEIYRKECSFYKKKVESYEEKKL